MTDGRPDYPEDVNPGDGGSPTGETTDSHPEHPDPSQGGTRVLQNTLKNIRARRDGEEGFTLIELMVVVLIIAILIAIAIPTFLGAKSRAQDKQAQSDVRNALTAAKTVFTDAQTYANATGTATNPNTSTAGMSQVEPSLNYDLTQSTDPKTVAVEAISTGANGSTYDEILLVARSNDNKCWAISDIQGAAAPQGRTVGTAYASFGDTNGACTLQAASNATWASAWS